MDFGCFENVLVAYWTGEKKDSNELTGSPYGLVAEYADKIVRLGLHSN